MRDEMTKRPYTTPQVVRVELTHEQAVLSQCSVSATTNSTNLISRCFPNTTPENCKKHASGTGRDSSSTS